MKPDSSRRDRFHQRWQALVAAPRTEFTEVLWADVRAGHPRFGTAVLADARITASNRGDRFEFRSRADAAVQALRLAIVSDAFFAQCCYRAKARCQALRIPLLPRILHRLAIVTGQISIGDPVVMQPGVYIPHGQIVVDGVTEVGAGAVLLPFVTVGLRTGDIRGPTIGRRAIIGTGAKIIGSVRVGERAKVGANAVVLTSVPDGATAAGVPARIVS
jgi:serine O-acetyltransferase